MSRALTLSCVVVLVGCGRRGALYVETIAPLPLVSTSRAIVQVVPQTNRAVVVTSDATAPVPVVVSQGAKVATKLPGRDVIAILSGTPRAPVLDLLDVETKAVTTLALPAAYDRLEFDPEGSLGVLSYDARQSSGLAARNLNDVAVLDVAATTLVRVQLDTEGLAPRSVVFGPSIAGRRLVAVALDRGVAIFDAKRPDVPARRIALRGPGSTVDAAVAELLFSRDGRWLFVRTVGADDVVVVELGPEVGTSLGASINFVAGGVGLSDLELAPEGAGDAVLASFIGSNEVMLLDARGIQDANKRLALPSALPNLTTLGLGRVLAWSPTSRSAVVWSVLDGRSGTATLAGPPNHCFLLAAQSRAAFTVPATETGSGAIDLLTVTDEPNRLRVRAQTLQLATRASAATLSVDGRSLFVAVPSGLGQASVVTVALETAALSEVLLDAPAARLFELDAVGQVVADHGAVHGDLSILPVAATARSALTRHTDFALSGALDRPEDAP